MVLPALTLNYLGQVGHILCLSVCLCVSVSLCLCVSVSLCLCVCASVCVSVCLSVSVFMLDSICTGDASPCTSREERSSELHFTAPFYSAGPFRIWAGPVPRNDSLNSAVVLNFRKFSSLRRIPIRTREAGVCTLLASQVEIRPRPESRDVLPTKRFQKRTKTNARRITRLDNLRDRFLICNC